MGITFHFNAGLILNPKLHFEYDYDQPGNSDANGIGYLLGVGYDSGPINLLVLITANINITAFPIGQIIPMC